MCCCAIGCLILRPQAGPSYKNLDGSPLKRIASETTKFAERHRERPEDCPLGAVRAVRLVPRSDSWPPALKAQLQPAASSTIYSQYRVNLHESTASTDCGSRISESQHSHDNAAEPHGLCLHWLGLPRATC